MNGFLSGRSRKAKGTAKGMNGQKAAKVTPGKTAKKAPARTSAKAASKPAAKTGTASRTTRKRTAGKAKTAAKPKNGKPWYKPGATAVKKRTQQAAKPAAGSSGKSRAAAQDDELNKHRWPLAARVLLLLVAFVAMVGFAVVLSKLTLGPSAASESLTHSNLRPGDSIHQYLSQPAIRDTVKQLGGNIVLGMPFGALLPVLAPRTRGLVRVILATALVMLLVELVQGALITGRAFDIDDVILNSTGAMLGYLIVGRRLGRAVHPRRRHWWQRGARAESMDGAAPGRR